MSVKQQWRLNDSNAYKNENFSEFPEHVIELRMKHA